MDQEIRDLQIATTRAYVMAERLAQELESTVERLIEHVESARGSTEQGAATGLVDNPYSLHEEST